MSLNFSTLAMLIGGLGLFLLAVAMITDGLKLAAGNALRDMLARSSRTPARGILTGISITAIVQSSSAVTVATIGFVNAGLLSLYQSLGIIYGANIGTTMTGWLVAIVGFKIKVEAFALPMIGFGMLVRLFRPGTRWGALGGALAGFGLFFIGIDVLKNAFEGMAAGFDLQGPSVPGLLGVFMYLGIGFLMTLFTQSSSAAIAITLTAATGGVLSIESAAAMVIGTNVGTTSTAAFAVIGATPNARRVASAHVMFNLLTGLVALIILPLLFVLIKYTGKMLGLEDNPAITLAMFHTLFNTLGVVLMWPLSDRLSSFLQTRFRSVEEVDSTPRFIDQTIIVSPSLALNAIHLEIKRVAELTRNMATLAIGTPERMDPTIESRFKAVESLARSINSFTVDMGRNTMSEETSRQLPRVVYALQCYTTIAELAFHYARDASRFTEIRDNEVNNAIAGFKKDVMDIFEHSSNEDPQRLDEMQQACHEHYRQLRNLLLVASTQHRLDMDMIGVYIDQIYRLDRMAKQINKGTRLVNELETITRSSTNTNAEARDTDELSETTY